MKEFFKMLFASMLGITLTIAGFFILLFLFLSALLAFSGPDTIYVPEKSILHLDLNYAIPERTPESPFEELSYGSESFQHITGLNDIVKVIRRAAEDPNIEGIYLQAGYSPSDVTILQEVRKTLNEFKESGKFIYAFSEFYSQRGYYLCSVADSIYLNPEGGVDFKGLMAQAPYLKGTLEKLKIDVTVVKQGRYKSAPEMLTQDAMSDAEREQVDAFLTGIWEDMLAEISASREIDIKTLQTIADDLTAMQASLAEQERIVDGLLYKNDFIASMENAANNTSPSYIPLHKYRRAPASISETQEFNAENEIAVIYASGVIHSGSNDNDQSVGSETFGRAIRKARKDKDIKAIVLRINSPGGSALASEAIWNEVRLAAEEKTMVVSMSSVAASGGYYIACPADAIVAAPTTLTGSIGVYGIFNNMSGFFNEHLGITFDQVQTNRNTDLYSGVKQLSGYQLKVVQNEIADIYATFKQHVAEGRGMSIEQVETIAQGRVWTGKQAMEVGLVDELGGLTAAIDKAASIEGLENYRVLEMPDRDVFLDRLIDFLSYDSAETILKDRMGEYYEYVQLVKRYEQLNGIQALLPFHLIIE